MMQTDPDWIGISCLLLLKSGRADRGRIWSVAVNCGDSFNVLTDDMTKQEARKWMKQEARRLSSDKEIMDKQRIELISNL